MLWHSDSYDDGVVDYWEVRIGGCPVQSIPEEVGGWFVVNDWTPGAPQALGSSLMPRRRRYFLSKADNRESRALSADAPSPWRLSCPSAPAPSARIRIGLLRHRSGNWLRAQSTTVR